jgi:hypothetical protein
MKTHDNQAISTGLDLVHIEEDGDYKTYYTDDCGTDVVDVRS